MYENKVFHETIGKGPEIVLLHGWGLHGGIWQFIATELAKEFSVTIIDLPGYGRSEWITDYTLEKMVKLLSDIAPKQAIWIGWSLGGLIATKYAQLYKDRVKKLICVASSPKFLEETNWPGMKKAVLEKFNQQLEVDYEETLKRFLLLQFYKVSLDKEKICWLNLTLFLMVDPIYLHYTQDFPY